MAVNEVRDVCPRKKTFSDVIRNFTPAWFTVIMGTGSISMLFHAFPYGTDSQVMKTFCLIFFFLNLALFVVFTALSAMRYTLFPGIWGRLLQHPAQSLFLAAFPVGLATLLSVSATVIYAHLNFGGGPFVFLVWGLWWLDVALSVLGSWGLLHLMITRQEHSFESMTPAWLLPVVPLVVAASTGATIAPALVSYSPGCALLTLTFSAFMVVVGLALLVMLLTIYLARIVTHGYSKGPEILSVFLPLGPSGQCSYAILLIGNGFKSMLPLTSGDTDGLLRKQSTGDTIDVVCALIAFAFWSYETMWMVWAFLGLWHSLRRTQVPFRLTFWCMIFPNGVYANCTLTLATAFSSTFYRIWGSIYAVATLMLWVYVSVQTLRMCPDGRIFDALPTEEDIGSSAGDDEKGLYP